MGDCIVGPGLTSNRKAHPQGQPSHLTVDPVGIRAERFKVARRTHAAAVSPHCNTLRSYKSNMARSLVIVESPANAKTMNKHMWRNFTVKASIGHVMDVPKKTIGIRPPRQDPSG